MSFFMSLKKLENDFTVVLLSSNLPLFFNGSFLNFSVLQDVSKLIQVEECVCCVCHSIQF